MNALELADKLGSLILMFEDREEGQFLKMAKDCQSMLRQQQLKIEALENEVSNLKLKIFTRKKWGSDIVSDGGLDPRNDYEELRKAQEK